ESLSELKTGVKIYAAVETEMLIADELIERQPVAEPVVAFFIIAAYGGNGDVNFLLKPDLMLQNARADGKPDAGFRIKIAQSEKFSEVSAHIKSTLPELDVGYRAVVGD